MTQIAGSRAFDVVDALHGERNLAGIARLLSTVAAECGFDVLAFGVGPDPARFANTWPGEWLQEYSEGSYFEDDPLVRDAVRRTGPFTWAEAARQRPRGPREARILDVCAANGWRDGLCVPIHGPGGYLAIASLAGREAAFSPRERAALQMIVMVAHERCLEVVGEPPPWAAVSLSPREAECLAWVAAGRTDAEIGDILALAEGTVRWHVDNARKKLGARTRAQAVARGVWQGIVRP